MAGEAVLAVLAVLAALPGAMPASSPAPAALAGPAATAREPGRGGREREPLGARGLAKGMRT